MRTLELGYGSFILDYHDTLDAARFTIPFPFTHSRPQEGVAVVTGSYMNSDSLVHGLFLVGTEIAWGESRPCVMYSRADMDDGVKPGNFWQVYNLAVELIRTSPKLFREVWDGYEHGPNWNLRSFWEHAHELAPELAAKWENAQVPQLDGILQRLDQHNRTHHGSEHISANVHELLGLVGNHLLNLTPIVRDKIIKRAGSQKELALSGDFQAAYDVAMDGTHSASEAELFRHYVDRAKRVHTAIGSYVVRFNRMLGEFSSLMPQFEAIPLDTTTGCSPCTDTSLKESFQQYARSAKKCLDESQQACTVFEGACWSTESAESSMQAFVAVHGALSGLDHGLKDMYDYLGRMYWITNSNQTSLDISETASALQRFVSESEQVFSGVRNARIEGMPEALSLYKSGPGLDLRLDS